MNWKKWLSLGLITVLVIGLFHLDMAKAADGNKAATAYIYFTDGWWASDVNYHRPGGEAQTKTIGQEALVTGGGVYHLALDFRQTESQHSNQTTRAKICIADGDLVFGTKSIITVQSLRINGIERTAAHAGFTAGETIYQDNVQKQDTVFYLFDSSANLGNITADREEGAERTAKDFNPFADFGITNIETLEIDFKFEVNAGTEPTEDPGNTPNPGNTPDPGTTPNPGNTPEPGMTPEPGTTPNPSNTPDPGTTLAPGVTPTPNPGNTPSTTINPGNTPGPGITSDPGSANGSTSGGSGLVSNSTYTGAEKILVQTNSVIIPAGGSSTVTFALLRSASSGTQVSASSGNVGIASSVLQNDGKVRIQVPGNAAAGSSTTVTLRFGSSSAAIKVTVKNAVTKIKAAKKSYKIKRKKKAKIVFQLTTQNKSKAATDLPAIKLSGKKASVSSAKVSGTKLTVTVKGIKKGSASLKVTMGGKSAKTKIKVR